MFNTIRNKECTKHVLALKNVENMTSNTKGMFTTVHKQLTVGIYVIAPAIPYRTKKLKKKITTTKL